MLTIEQQAARKGKITASMVGKLMNGTEADINALWEELTGRREPDDIGWKWPVYLGTHTEELHLNWIAHTGGVAVERRGEVVIHLNGWAACTLDGWAGYPVEVKHTGGFEDFETIVARYYPQCQWQMFVTDAAQAMLSVIMGARQPRAEFIPRNDDYIADMEKRARAFLTCVEEGRPPFDIPEPPAPVEFESLRKIDLADTDVNWRDDMAALLVDWSFTKTEADVNANAAKEIKKLLPGDVGEVLHALATIKRSRSGAVSIKVTK